MEQQQEVQSVLVVWRGQSFVVEMNPSATLKEMGQKLQELTNVEGDTMRLFVPFEKSSKVFYPFSNEHSLLNLESISVFKGKSIRMMGVPKDEVDEILQNEKANHRIAGFDEEEKRMKQRYAYGSIPTPKLPQGNYIFCDFQTLSLPGIELNPPASKALNLLHKLASDPGIVAIMNKHRWRVGLLTELAPVGYVGVSPKCILGFNKNHGEEISLRLRTDDLKGFRKYESIKKTLLHELAHMVFSEHDSNFFALNSQLNKEAATLDWTKSRGHTLSGFSYSGHEEEEFDTGSNMTSHKLGGQTSFLPNARAASVNAAFERLANASTNSSGSSEESGALQASDVDGNQNGEEPDIDDSILEPDMESQQSHVDMNSHHEEGSLLKRSEQSDIDDSRIGHMEVTIQESNLDDSVEDRNEMRVQNAVQPDGMNILTLENTELRGSLSTHLDGLHPNDSTAGETQLEHDPVEAATGTQTVEPDPDNLELQVIQDPVIIFCNHLQSAIQSLKYEAKPSEAGTVLQTLIKIIRNIIEHPEDMKFKRLRKANPMIQKNILTYKAAVNILTLVGFCEDNIVDEWGRAEVFLTLKRNDPGLLWLTKSSLESHVS
ncbi:uncharacterized protein LOC127254282 [Andrographis paniculata]|uniref:uncharacterized protein LOC127254282 n=1 Tax=Andrographis paniculata TaxID=175694 RepID=UPI0021E6F510|nr:uncharacterized protein LOC127254282 [Andrographis paniculata]XP_051135267.1 uncharacterized protein LOC127254282 [Andrographis paniculata]XP_051135268.1 uncharacterized protein LOC127254282 [Andrographis paniculata]